MDSVSKQVGYLVHYKRNVKNLKTTLFMMEDMKNDLQHRVDDNRKNLSEVDDRVVRWLSASDDMHEQVTHFLRDDTERNRNIKSRYVLSRKAIKFNEQVRHLLQEAATFISVDPLPVSSVIRPDFQDFQSRLAIVNQALEALMDDELSIISICGMPGSGKTAITHQLSEIIQVRGLFGAGKVLPVCVTHVPDAKRIQNELVNLLGLRLHAADPYFTSLELHERLSDDDERKLLILDDVWEEVDLETIGIPSAGKANKLQILLTSEREDVCIRMGSQRNFSVPPLAKDEAWDFFRQKAFKGDSIRNQTHISSLAMEIVNFCEGLPLAIATMATELKDRSMHVWFDALNEIRTSNWHNLPGMRQVFSRLELSYDHLHEELKSCFLLCCLFPRGSNILIEDLIRYGMRLGLFEQVDNSLEASNRVHSLIYHLKRSFLLLEGDTDDSVKMHNVVRNFAIAVASRDKSYVCCDGEMINLPETDKLRSCTAMSFVCEEINERPILECPKLQFLLFVSRKSSQSLNCFFQGMKTGELGKLKILAIKTQSCPKLPEEIGLLTNLRLLDLGGMSGLKYIPPGVLSELSKLEELYVTPEFCGWGSRVEGEDAEVINASLSELELLPITNFEISVPKGSILPHLPFFKNLVRHESGLGNTLLTIGEVSEEDQLVLEGDTSHAEEDCALLKKIKDLRLVKVQKLKSIEQLMDISKQIASSPDSQLQYFSNLRYLAIESCGDLKHMFPLYLCGMLSQLQKIRINDCIKMDGILYGKGKVDEVLFPYLTKLELTSVPNLNGFWVDIDNADSGGLLTDQSSDDDSALKGTSSSTEQPSTSEIETESSLVAEIGRIELNFVLFPYWIQLSNLEELRLQGCTLLRVAFPSTVAEQLVKLKTLEIRWCWNMEYIVATIGRPEEKDRRSSTRNPVFPKLTSFIVDGLPELMAFSSDSHFYLEWSSLEELTVSKCPKIKTLASTLPPDRDIRQDELLVSTNEILFKIPPQLEGSMNVKFLEVRLCDNLTHLFSSRAAKFLTELERMEIKYCEKMKEVVAEEEDEEEECELSSLESVTFDGCFQLKTFSDKNSFSTPNLKELHINGSQYPFAGDLNATIKEVMLSKLRIFNMKQLVRIGRDQIPDEDLGEIRDLEIEGCDKLLNAIPYNLIVRLRKLEKLAVMWCDSLEEIFEYKGAMEFEGKNVVAFSHLEEITLFDLENLKDVFTGIPRTMTGFQKLRKLCVHGCHSLRNIFSVASVRGLLLLQELKISSCNRLEEIVAKEDKEEIQGRDKIVFPQLRSIDISNSATLESFYSGIYDLVMPLLESLHLNLCPSIRKFSHGSLTAPKLQKVQGDCKETSLIRTSPIVDLDEIIAKKKKRKQLRVYNRKNLQKIGHDQLPYEDLSQIHELEIQACDELLCAIPCNLKPTDLQKLEMLVVRRCHLLEEIFEHRGPSFGSGSITTFSNLEEITLLHLEKLQHVFCEIPKETARFQKLRKLHIHDCYSLRNVFTVSTVKGLQELEELKLSSCDGLEEIVAEGEIEEQAITDKIVFPQLRSIDIGYSPKLVCFYSGIYALELPLLKSVFLYKCPCMLTFSNGLLTTPSQLKVQIDNANYKLLEDGLNATMKYKDLLLQQDKNSQGLEEHQQDSGFASGSSAQMYSNSNGFSSSVAHTAALEQENQMLKQKLALMEQTIANLQH